MGHRAVITGIGLLTPLGNSPATFFQRALRGESCIRRVKKFDTSSYAVQIGAELDLEAERDSISAEFLPEMPVVARWSVLAARAAVRDASLEIAREDPFSIDIIVGISMPSLEALEKLQPTSAGMATAPARTAVLISPAAAAVQISRDLQIYGETANITTACSSTTTAIGYAVRQIQHGESSCIITGGADEGVSPLFLGALGNSPHLSHRNASPGEASRPFERQRDGYVVSDAACIFVIEEYERAKRRGAPIYCEISGFGASSDSTSAFKLSTSEEPGARALEKALARSGRSLDQIDYYCALGVSLPSLDARETRMVKRVFRERASKLAVSSIKSMMGHPIGAAGAVQVAASALSIKHSAVPPTINYEEPDPDCDLDYVPNEARSMKVRNALVYTLGNGGCNAAVVVSAC